MKTKRFLAIALAALTLGLGVFAVAPKASACINNYLYVDVIHGPSGSGSYTPLCVETWWGYLECSE